MITEFIGGYYTNSLALMADAGHMLSDVTALSLSFFALWLVQKSASPEKTYGYYRAEILVAFVNGITLVGIALYILYEAYYRFVNPPEVHAPIMIIIAFGGFIINTIGAVLLHRPSKENLNIKAAFLHVLGDLLGSVGAIISGLLILFWNFYLADPIVSCIIAVLILISSIRLVNEAVNILLEASPSHINVETIRTVLTELPSVIDVHDLHVWSISSKNIALSVHIVSEEADFKKVLCSADSILKEKFGIMHITIQIEPPGFHESGCFF